MCFVLLSILYLNLCFKWILFSTKHQLNQFLNKDPKEKSYLLSLRKKKLQVFRKQRYASSWCSQTFITKSSPPQMMKCLCKAIYVNGKLTDLLYIPYKSSDPLLAIFGAHISFWKRNHLSKILNGTWKIYFRFWQLLPISSRFFYYGPLEIEFFWTSSLKNAFR